MIRAVTEYLRECGRLLKWVFFQPSKLSTYFNQIEPNYQIAWGRIDWSSSLAGATKLFWRTLLISHQTRLLVLKVLILSYFLPTIGCGLMGWLLIAVGKNFNWQGSIIASLCFIVFNLLFGGLLSLSIHLVAGIRNFLLLGVSGTFASGMLCGLANKSDPKTIFFAFLGGTVISWIIHPISTSHRGYYFPPLILLFLTRVIFVSLPLYLIEIIPAIRAYKRTQRDKSPEQELLRSPIFLDEHIFFPQPYLSSLILQLLQHNLPIGLKFAAHISAHPHQNWAAQKALIKYFSENSSSFFPSLNLLLDSPPPYRSLGTHLGAFRAEDEQYVTVTRMLDELSGGEEQSKTKAWLRKLLIRLRLKMPEIVPISLVAMAYFNMLIVIINRQDKLQNHKSLTSKEIISEFDLAFTLRALTQSANLPYGMEFLYSWLFITQGLDCENLKDIADLRNKYVSHFNIKKPLRPQIIAILNWLRDASQDATSFLTAEHELTRRDALLKAGGVLEEARELANEVYEPERSLLLAVIEHWRRIFAIEGGRVAERREVEALPNPYVAGRPIRPEDGRLFAGRRGEMKLIEEKLQTGVGIVIWGQRRIGKSSILLHLPGHLSHDLLPVYLNLQNLMANTTGGFLHAVAREIAKQMRGVWSSGFSLPGSNGENMPPEGGTPNLPSASDFADEPYLSFNHLLEQIEERLQPGQRVLLSFDEFEELEQRVKDGKIEKEIFTYLRSITQTGRGFAMLFAGLHTLEEMTREYWNPFFQSVQTIRIGYLGESDAEALIRDPMEQFPLDYELEAVNRITKLTNSHPYLTQSLCHNLVNRLNDPLHRSQLAKQEDVYAVVERTLESGFYYFDDYVWERSSERERLALALLAEATSDIGEEAPFAIVEKHLGRDAALDATRRLVSREILSERTGERGELVFSFQIPLAQMWVKQKKPSARILMEGGRL